MEKQAALEQYELENTKRADLFLERHKIEEEIEILLSNKTTIGTCSFKFAYDAERYYGVGRKEIEQKIEAGEIAIKSYTPDNLCSYDADGRMHELFSALEIRERQVKLREVQGKIDAINQLIRDLDDTIHILKRSECTTNKKNILAKTKTDLERQIKAFVDAKWERRLPYCCDGRPFYYQSVYDKEYYNSENNREATIFWRGAQWRLLIWRSICAPKGDHWGMAVMAPSSL